MMKCLLSVTTLGTAALTVLPAIAQSETPVTSASSIDEQSQGLADIIVTAQRRNESLQKAAIAVTALSTDVVRTQVTAGESLGKLVPSVVIGAGGGGTNLVAIRGIGTLAPNGLTENVVAFNLDGVYLARPAAASGVYYDLERIEVLKGPQGTLYGRNATAGAINMITAPPSFTPGGYVDAQFGNYDMYQAQGAINVPVSDKVAMRFAGQGIHRIGYFSDGYNDQKQYSGRASLRVEPNTDLSVLLTADYAHIGGKGSTNVLSPFIDPSNPYLGPSESANQAPYLSFTPFPLSPVRDDGFNDLNLWGVSGNVEWRTAVGTLTILPAYRRSDLSYRHYSAGFEVNNRNELSRQKTLEIRFATPDENGLRAVFGGYYFKEHGAYTITFETVPTSIQPVGVDDIRDYDTRSLAAFGQATWDVVDNVRIIGGLRYSSEKKSVNGFSNNGAPVTGRLSNSNISWRAGIEADVGPRSLLFATMATGFKAGGFFASLPPNTYEPEKLTAYTIGSKNRFADNRIQLNAEFYYWQYDNKQVSHLGPVRPAGFNLITENAGKATLYGAEVEANFLITPDDLLSGNLLYNHTRYESFVYKQTTLTGPPTTTCAVRPSTAASVVVDCSGNVLQQAPKWSANVRFEHTFGFASGSRLVFGASGTYRSSYWLGDEHLVGQLQGGYAMADLDLIFHAPKDGWYLAAFVQNVGDKAVMSQSFVQPLLGQPVVGLYPPRTYGLRAGLSF